MCRNLSCNKLNGSIAADLGKLSDLRELDLENNTLSGGIPTGLGDLTGGFDFIGHLQRLVYPAVGKNTTREFIGKVRIHVLPWELGSVWSTLDDCV